MIDRQNLLLEFETCSTGRNRSTRRPRGRELNFKRVELAAHAHEKRVNVVFVARETTILGPFCENQVSRMDVQSGELNVTQHCIRSQKDQLS